jgi:hypothetical protein
MAQTIDRDGPTALADADEVVVLTTLAEASPAVKTFLSFYNPVGPLAGKTAYAVLAYAVAWALLAVVLRGRSPRLGPAFTWTFVLVGLGLLGTFPIFFEAFTVK